MACRKLHNIYRIKLIGPAKNMSSSPICIHFPCFRMLVRKEKFKKVVKEQKGTFKRRNMKKKRMITPPPPSHPYLMAISFYISPISLMSDALPHAVMSVAPHAMPKLSFTPDWINIE